MKKLLILLLALSFTAFGQIRRYQVEFTRPANSTAYTAGDIVADSTTGGSYALKFPVLSPVGKIIAARMEADTSVATNGTFRLHFFADSAGLGRLADNAAFTPVDTVYDSLAVGYINFTLQAAGTASSQIISHYITSTAVDIPYRLPQGNSAQTKIWGVLTATAAWVPNNAGKIRITLWIEEK